MLTNLRLENFKNFKKADLKLGPFTVLVGTNASGKSNVRDAFRFLHGVSRGYDLASIFGEVRHDSGVLQWSGIRGGAGEACTKGATFFSLNIELDGPGRTGASYNHKIKIKIDGKDKEPRVVDESLLLGGEKIFYIDKRNSHDRNISAHTNGFMTGWVNAGEGQVPIPLPNNRTGLSKIAKSAFDFDFDNSQCKKVVEFYNSMRFIELNAEAIRIPSQVGQVTLGDRGENLSSVLKAICDEKKQKKLFLNWLRDLTPMDVVDLEFNSDLTGKVLLVLKEKGGKLISAHSASDGTLRFLAVLAALLGPEPSRFYFIEELENGIHPTRLHLLIQLIEKKVAEGKIQVVATTHSPYLVGLLGEESRKYVSIINREEGQKSATITNLMDIPHAKDVLKKQDLAKLHATGWMENVISFSNNKKKSEKS